jgi:hypothetical protein
LVCVSFPGVYAQAGGSPRFPSGPRYRAIGENLNKGSNARRRPYSLEVCSSVSSQDLAGKVV